MALGFVVIGFGFALYYAPYFIATQRRIANEAPLFWVNALLGWTGIMWIACLIWSIVEQPSKAVYSLAPPGASGEAIWHYTAAGQRHGPVRADEITRLIQARRIAADALVWQPAFGASWRSAREAGLVADR